MRTIVFVLMAALASPAGAFEPEDRLAAGVYAGFSFGGATGARDARAGLRLDAAAAPATDTAPLARWELRRDAAEFAVAGRPLLSYSLVAAYEDGETTARSSRLSWGLLAVAAGAALTAAVVNGAEDALSEGADQAAGEAAEAVFFGGEGEEQDPPPCESVEIADNCIGG